VTADRVPTVPGLTGLSVLARGGYATVYRAMQESVGRLVAVKVENRILESERDQRRFMREARAAGRMSSHPHVVDLFDAGVTASGHPFLIMELCRGSYSERMRMAPLAPAEVRDIGIKIADALADAHELGVLHRDVKPANILVTDFGEPALADFGLAILTENRDISITLDVLTPAYAPPEMFRHAAPAPAADVFSLCATLYALMAGRPPRWPGSRDPSLVSLVDMFEDPVPDLPHVPRELMGLILHGMSNVEGQRPSAAEVRDALFAMELGVVAPSALGPEASQIGGSAPRVGAPASDERDATRVVGANGPGGGGLAGAGGGLAGVGTGGPGGLGEPGGPSGPGGPGGLGGAGRAGGHDGPGLPRGPRGPGVGGPGGPGAGGPGAGGPGAGGPGGRVGLVGFEPGGRGGSRPGGSRPGGPGGPGRPAAAAGRRDRVSPQRIYLWGGFAAVYVAVFCAAIAAALFLRPDEPTTTFMAPPPPSKPACPLTPAGTAQCVTTAECFDRVTVSGGVAKATAVACTEPHLWEAFATAQLPDGLDTASHTTVKQNALVRQVCSTANARSLNTEQAWQVEVLPPTREQVKAGDRTVRCLAGRPPTKLTQSRFVP
jgi:tRNA A-37 threonylcarbamoyl transferase component Bud32